MRRYLLIALAALAVEAGCTLEQYAQQADRSAHRTLAVGQRLSLGESKPFDIEFRPYRPEPEGRAGIVIGRKVIPLGEGKLVAVTLREALEIAFRNSRKFQNRKETLYTEALALANVRRDWDWAKYGGPATGSVRHARQSGAPSDVSSASASLRPTFTQNFITGAQLALGAGVGLTSDLLRMESTFVGSFISANLTQPLLRGAWRGTAYEEVYRQTRDFTFSVFNYERFTQTFAVEIVTGYYNVLQQRDQLENDKSNIQRIKETLALTKALVENGDRSRIEQDQAEQDLLNARVSLERNQQNYRNALDRFKVTLGLPVSARMDVDYPAELESLNRAGPKAVVVAEARAVAVALSARPDVLTQRAALRDAQRNVEIAADDFLPQLDLTLGIDAPGTAPRDWSRIQFHKHSRKVKLDFSYELDQTNNRDAYRNAMIAHDKAKRDYAEFEDQVRIDVRESFRSLVQSRRTYGLRKQSLEIAKRRRTLAALQQKEGQASARDVLEAEDALRNAQNGLTNSLISYTTTRLDFLATLGMLRVDEKGTLNERDKPFGFEPLQREYPETGPR